MNAIDFEGLVTQVRDALHACFADLLAANPDRSFYTFAVWTDDSLQFLHAAANTEEGLTATVERYRREVDPEYDTVSTRNGMRWSYGDWEFFPVEDDQHFAEINETLRSNFDAEEEVFEENLGPLWESLIEGFRLLDNESFFGNGVERARITLLVVGNVPENIATLCVKTLNPPSVAQAYIDWDPDAPDPDD